MSGRGVLFPRRGTPAISWQIPKKAGKVCCEFAGREEEMGVEGPPVCVKDMCTHTGTLFHRLACTSTYPQALPPGTQTYRHVGEICMGCAHTCRYSHAQLLHSHATSKCTHSWAHRGICTKFACSGYIYWPKSTLTRDRNSCRHLCTCIKVWIH